MDLSILVGIIGVLVGAAATGGVNYILERRKATLRKIQDLEEVRRTVELDALITVKELEESVGHMLAVSTPNPTEEQDREQAALFEIVTEKLEQTVRNTARVGVYGSRECMERLDNIYSFVFGYIMSQSGKIWAAESAALMHGLHVKYEGLSRVVREDVGADVVPETRKRRVAASIWETSDWNDVTSEMDVIGRTYGRFEEPELRARIGPPLADG